MYGDYRQPNIAITHIDFTKALERHVRSGTLHNHWATRADDNHIVFMFDLLNDKTRGIIDSLVNAGSVASVTQDSYVAQIDPWNIKQSLSIGIRPWLITLIPDSLVGALIASSRLGPLYRKLAVNLYRAMGERPRTIPVFAISGSFAGVATIKLDGTNIINTVSY